MKHLLCALFLFLSVLSFSQTSPIKPNKYPSLLWEIKGKGLKKPSYLFGTMHVSNKMAFNLSDSFYLGIRNAQVVALETNPGTWQEDFSRYDLEGESLFGRRGFGNLMRGYAAPQDFLSINSIRLTSYEKMMEAALYSNPSIINNFLYRSNSETASDFEEDTYLDLHIFQTGTKLGKKLCGVEDFHGSMQLVKEAYMDAAKEKGKRERSYDIEEHLSYRNMEEAYRTGNLDLLDTINKVNSQSAAFDEKFLYKRNDIQAASIDSILKKGQVLFVGVGAAHLPGERGVIEILRRMGYTLRPIKMKERDSQHKDAIEKIRVPVKFSRETSADGFFSVNVPGKLYSFSSDKLSTAMWQHADMSNGSYYMVSRIFTNAAILGHNEAQVERKIDSVLYENIPGKILSKKAVVKNGYKGFDISNRTRRGDYQRYHIFVTPFEIIIFKMSGNGDYVKLGTEAAQFFSSIQLKEQKPDWKKFKPSYGGFEVEMPHEPFQLKKDNWIYAAYDQPNRTAYEIIRTDVHNYNFLEEDSFDLNLMEESFASSDYVQRQLNQKITSVNRYPALDVKYKFKDSSVALVRFLIDGPRYYTLIAKAQTENRTMQQFVNSFAVKPFVYGELKKEVDTALLFTVNTPVPLEQPKKLSMYPDSEYFGNYNTSEDDSLVDDGIYLDKIVANDSTGERIYVSFYKNSNYYQDTFKEKESDSLDYDDEWFVRKKKVDTLADKTRIYKYDLGSKKSSRLIRTKAIEKEGFGYQLQTQLDTLSAPSAFISSFFTSFAAVDTVKGIDPKKKKSSLFFTQFFSTDSLQHKTAIQNIHNITLDSTDFPELKRSIESLSWKEKKYLDVKKSLLRKMAFMPTKPAADFLKEQFYAVGDTVDLQYTILESLLVQKTAYSYKIFADILANDPPVLDAQSSMTTNTVDYSNMTVAITDTMAVSNTYSDYGDGSFLNNLNDSLQLTAGIYQQLLPLINLDDYEQPMMNKTAALLEKGLIGGKDFESYLPKLLIEAKQLLKKQLIQEKTKAIHQAQRVDEEKSNYNRYETDEDNGNNRLSLYATLLLPFWDKHTQVPQLINQMLLSNDKRLKYNTALLLAKKNRSVADTMWQFFASLDDYRYDLYSDLKRLNKLSLFPAAQKNQLAIAKSQLLSEQTYNKPDTLVFLEAVPMRYQEKEGQVLVFKYKDNRTDNSWKLATVGLLPKDEMRYEFDGDEKEEKDDLVYSFTELSSTKLSPETPEKEQIRKLIKRLQYGKRKSAAQFYTNSDSDGYFDFHNFRD